MLAKRHGIAGLTRLAMQTFRSHLPATDAEYSSLPAQVSRVISGLAPCTADDANDAPITCFVSGWYDSSRNSADMQRGCDLVHADCADIRSDRQISIVNSLARKVNVSLVDSGTGRRNRCRRRHLRAGQHRAGISKGGICFLSPADTGGKREVLGTQRFPIDDAP